MGRLRSVGHEERRPCRQPNVHFFQMILETTVQARKLMLPFWFVEKYGDELSNIAKLTVDYGRVWEVELTRGRNSIWFDSGWHEFADYHSVCSGYLLIFTYNGMSNFNVIMFNLSAFEIQYPLDAPSSEEEEDDADSDSVEVLSCNPLATTSKGISRRMDAPFSEQKMRRSAFGFGQLAVNKGLKSSSVSSANKGEGKRVMKEEVDISSDDEYDSGQDISKENEMSKVKTNGNYLSQKLQKRLDIITPNLFSSILAQSYTGTKRAVNAAQMCKPKNPSFMVILRSLNINRSYLNVPSLFAKKYLYGVPEYIKLQVSNGKEWHVQIRRNEIRCFLGQGWSEFSRDNYLEEGDVCLFELIMAENVGLKTLIFHATSVQSGQGIKKRRKNFEPETTVRRIVVDDANESKKAKMKMSCKTEFDEEESWYVCDDTKIITSKQLPLILTKASEETKRAYKAAKKLKPSNPSFLVMLQPYNFANKFLLVPNEFADKYLPEVPEHIIVKVSDGGTWRLKRLRLEGRGLHYKKGWEEFSTDNSLKEGDVCLFELIQRKVFGFKVSIIRA